jgi:GNAT superfamily N-acetyltransferase
MNSSCLTGIAVLREAKLMNNRFVVRKVTSWRDRRRFQRLPWSIYSDDKNWVPPVLSQERELLGWKNHPFFDNAEIITLLAERNGRAVGRLAVLINHIHNRKYNEKQGFFGFFECIDDTAVAGELFQAGRDWLKQRKMTTVLGPVNPSLNYTCGLLIDAFDCPACFLMTYNPPYYASLLEACGFTKAQDMYAYEMDMRLLSELTARYKPAVLSMLDRPDLVVRSVNPARLRQEIETYLDIYNRSLDGTWGFTPLQPREARHIADELRRLIVPQLTAFAQIDGRPIGAVFGLLDYNQILGKCNGRLFPFGMIRLITERRKINTVRAMAMTMVPGYQDAGLSVVLIDHLTAPAAEWGIRRWELSWVLESNSRSRGTLERVGMKRIKTYRIYEKAL